MKLIITMRRLSWWKRKELEADVALDLANTTSRVMEALETLKGNRGAMSGMLNTIRRFSKFANCSLSTLQDSMGAYMKMEAGVFRYKIDDHDVMGFTETVLTLEMDDFLFETVRAMGGGINMGFGFTKKNLADRMEKHIRKNYTKDFTMLRVMDS